MYWTIVFAIVALAAAPFALTAGVGTPAALFVSVVFAVLALGSAAGALLAHLR